MTKLNILAAAAVATLALAGCTGVPASTTSTAPAGTNQGTSAPAEPVQSQAEETETATAEDATVESGVAAFGKAYTWEDGLAVTVSAPKPYKPGEWAAGTDQHKHFVAFEVRVVNGTDSAWDPALFTATVQSDNTEGSQVYDSEKLPDQPTTKLLKGRESKFTVAFGVDNPKDLVMEVNPDFEHESVLFQQ